MPTWIAILIGASVGLSTLVYTVMAKRRDRREEALRREQDQKDAAVQREVARREEEAEWRGEVNADRTAFKEFMQDVRGKLERILGIIEREFPASG